MSGRSLTLHMVNLSRSGLETMVPHTQDQESSPCGHAGLLAGSTGNQCGLSGPFMSAVSSAGC